MLRLFILMKGSEMKNRKFVLVVLMLIMVLCSVVPCYADSDIIENVKDLITTYYDVVSGLAVALGAFLCLIAAVVWAVFPSDKGAELGKKWFFRILGCILLVLCLGGIIRLLENITQDSGFNAKDYVDSIPKIR